MTELGNITLENEMDLTLAYKKSIFIAERLGLTPATQTAFATAVSEVCRDVIDKATSGLLSIGTIAARENRYALQALVTYDPTDKIPHPNPGYEYAKKLVPVFNKDTENGKERIALSLTMPRSLNLNESRIREIRGLLLSSGPINSYEEIKFRNRQLQQVNLQHEQELVSIKYLNEQKKEFLSIASHELNGPLTVAHSMAQIILKLGPKVNPVLTQYLQRLHLHTGKLVRLTRQLLDISRMETGNFNYEREVIPVPAFLSQVTENLKLLCPDHRISAVLFQQDVFIHADRIKIEQVFNNIVGNAAKYSDTGTQIAIEAKQLHEHLEVTISDEGIGMSEDTLSHVFGKFFRGKNEKTKFSGLGMGLYVTATIIEDHRGTLRASSEPGKGSAFTFTIPLYNK